MSSFRVSRIFLLLTRWKRRHALMHSDRVIFISSDHQYVEVLKLGLDRSSAANVTQCFLEQFRLTLDVRVCAKKWSTPCHCSRCTRMSLSSFFVIHLGVSSSFFRSRAERMLVVAWGSYLSVGFNPYAEIVAEEFRFFEFHSLPPPSIQ